MNRLLKNACLSAAAHAGVTSLFGRTAWRRRRLLILGYHGISLADEHEWDPYLYVSPASFDRRLEILHRTGCHVLPLGEALERLYRGDLPDRAVCLTFDDGYFNFVVRAHPRLRQYRFPATVYLNTLGCEHGLPLVRIGLSYVLWKSGAVELSGGGLPGLQNRAYSLATRQDRLGLATAIHNALLAAGVEALEQNAVLREVASRVAIDYDALVRDRIVTLMSPADVGALAADGVDFQMHTHRHTNPMEADAFRWEIRENAWRIEAMTGRRPTHFCYPCGIWRPSYFGVLESEAVASATTTHPGIAGPVEPSLLLPRFMDMNSVSDAGFESWVTGVAPCLRMSVRRVVGERHNYSDDGSPIPRLVHPT